MLLQQAHLNCKRCYELAQPYIRASKIMDRECIERNNYIYQARNDTMDALREDLKHEEVDSELAKEIREIAATCADCDFKKAHVAEWAKPIYMKELEQELKEE